MIDINLGSLSHLTGTGKSLAGRLSGITGRIAGCSEALSGCGSGFGSIRSEISALEQESRTLAKGLESYSSALEKILSLYRKAEQKSCSLKTSEKAGGAGSGGTGRTGTGKAAGFGEGRSGSGRTGSNGKDTLGTGRTAGSGKDTLGTGRTAGSGKDSLGTGGRTCGGKDTLGTGRTAGGENSSRTETANKHGKQGTQGNPGNQETQGNQGNQGSVSGSGGINQGARKVLLGAGISEVVIDQWEKEGLKLTRDEAEKNLSVLTGLASGSRYPSTAEFSQKVNEAAGEAPKVTQSGGVPDVQQQTSYLNTVAGVMLSCYPNISMTMNRKTELPIAPGVSAYCSVSGTGAASSKSPVSVSETLDAHSKILKDGISFSTDGGSIRYSDAGRSMTIKTDEGSFSADEKGAGWSAKGKISENTTCEVKIRVNYASGETSCEESLTTKEGKASITTTMGVKVKPEDSGSRTYPGYEKDMALVQQSRELQSLLVEGLVPGLAGGLESVPVGTGSAVTVKVPTM